MSKLMCYICSFFRRMYREASRSIFSRDPLVASIEEAATAEELQDKPDIDEVLLQKALHLNNGCCLLDPALTVWALHPGMNGAEGGQKVHLTTCEQEILALQKQGLTISQIAQRRSISQTTVKKHLQNASRKLREI